MSEPPEVLCQPDADKSCGACCGMYNRVDSGQQATLARLRRRTRAFHRTADVDDEASLRAFRARWEETRADRKLLSGLPNCPFLGLLDADDDSDREAADAKVGCLVHPMQNDGVDGRDCGVYDRRTCEEYLCAAHDLMRDREKLLVIQAVADSYLYGLVITDVRFVRQLFEQAARINGMDPPPRCVQRKAAVEAAAAYFELKRDWPFGADGGVFGQVQPEEGLEYSRREGPAEALGVEPGPFAPILTCLATDVDSVDQLRRARRIVCGRVAAFADAVAL